MVRTFKHNFYRICHPDKTDSCARHGYSIIYMQDVNTEIDASYQDTSSYASYLKSQP